MLKPKSKYPYHIHENGYRRSILGRLCEARSKYEPHQGKRECARRMARHA
jgi:hypothetical protein